MPHPNAPGQMRRFASPVSRALARSQGLNLAAVVGSGPQGRIVRADVMALLDRPDLGRPDAQTLTPPDLPFDDIPMGLGRKLMARRLSESKQQAPHFYARMDCNLDAVVQARAAWGGPADEKPSINAFVIRAAAQALKSVPGVNASCTDAAIRHYRAIHISVAVAIKDGLVTPVITNADNKSMAQITRELHRLAQQARSGTLAAGALRGGTFSISSLGSYGVREFTAVINPPQAAILAVGAAEPRAVVVQGQLAVATMMTVVLSADHRIIDGALAARWLVSFRSAIENPQDFAA